MVASVKAAVRMFSGETLTFSEKVTRLVGTSADPATWRIAPECHDAIDVSLRRLGFTRGDLAARLHAWNSARAIAADTVMTVLDELCVEARRRTRAHIFDTGSYEMAITPVRDVTYTARCGFASRQMQLNMTFGSPARH